MRRWALGLAVVAACSSPAEPPVTPEPATPTAVAPTTGVPKAEQAPVPDEQPDAPMAHDRLPDAQVAARMHLTEGSAGPVIMSTVTLAATESLELPPSANHEHLVLVLAGELELSPGDAPGALVKAWHAVRARGVPVTLHAMTDATLVRALVHGDPMRKRDVEVRNLAEHEQLTWAGGKAHARLGFEDGRASFGLLSSHREVGVPRHRHQSSTEVVGLLSGEGTMGLGDDHRRVAAGDVFDVTAGVEHDFAPDGTETLFAVQLYVPPGPEQRFKALARDAAP